MENLISYFNMAPSIYEYRTEREFELAMAIWCEENEPKATKWLVGYIENYGTKYIGFPNEGAAREWCARHNDIAIIRCEPESVCSVRPVYHKPQPGAPDHLDGGSAADYRMAGYNRF